MMEFDQDLAVLEGSLCSLVKTLNTENDEVNLMQIPNEVLPMALKSFNKVIKSITSGIHRKIDDIPNLIRKLHIAVFYNVLKSNGISCSEADEYYITVRFLPISWKFYVNLLAECDWTDCYIECVTRLPNHVAAIALENTSKEISDLLSHSQRCSIHHCILQAALYKTCSGIRNPKHPIVTPHVHFPFDCRKSNLDENSSILRSIGTSLAFIRTQLTSLEGLNALVKFLALLADMLVLQSARESSSSEFLYDCLQTVEITDEVKEFLSKSLFAFDFEEFSKNSLGPGFNQDIGHTTFVLWAKYRNLQDRNEPALCKTVFPAYVKLYNMILDMMPSIVFIHPLFTEFEDPVVNHYIRMLDFIVDNKLEGSKDVFKFIVENPEMLDLEDVLLILEKNNDSFCEDIECLSLFMTAVSKNQNVEEKVTNIFMTMYRKANLFTQDVLYSNFLAKFGLSTSLKQREFDSELYNLLYRASDKSEAITYLFLLCLQSGEETLQKIMNKTVCYGGVTALFLVQILKNVPNLCVYKDLANGIPLLVKFLIPHFKDLNNAKSENFGKETDALRKNILVLVETLVKVFRGTNVFPNTEFLHHCILPNLHPSVNRDTLYFTIEVLNVIFSMSLESISVTWLESLNLVPLIMILLQLVDFSISISNGNLKAMLISVLDALNNLAVKFNTISALLFQDSIQKWLLQNVNSVSNVARFYGLKFFKDPNIIDVNTLALPECLCLQLMKESDDVNLLKQCLQNKQNYDLTSLFVIATAAVLPHFTASEFEKLANVLCHKDLQIFVPIAAEFESQNCDNGKLKRLTFIEFLVDAILVLANCESQNLDWTYMLTCALTVIKNETEAMEHLPFKIKALFDVCRLAKEFTSHSEMFKNLIYNIAIQMKKMSESDALYKRSMKYLLSAIQIVSCDDSTTKLFAET